MQVLYAPGLILSTISIKRPNGCHHRKAHKQGKLYSMYVNCKERKKTMYGDSVKQNANKQRVLVTSAGLGMLLVDIENIKIHA
jgi:hypothetical protein